MRLKRYLRTGSHHVTWFLGAGFPRAIPLVFVVGYPKSGTTWACQLLGLYLQLPFPRFALHPVLSPAVVHGHERFRRRYRRGVYVVRDGRDAITSMYFFKTRDLAEGDRPPMTSKQRAMFPGLVNKDNVRDNIAAFVERQMTHPHSCKLNWGNHVRSYFDVVNPGMALLRYEDLLDDGAAALARVGAHLTGDQPDPQRARLAVDRFSFRSQTARQTGDEDRSSFLRKGQSGDWRNHFTREAAEIFDRYCGRTLIQAGYEPDNSWVRTIDDADGATVDQPVAPDGAKETT